MLLRVTTIIVIVLLSLNVIRGATSTKKCATLYNSAKFEGTPYTLSDDARLPNLRQMNFVPSSVRVTAGCSLTVTDVYRYQQIFESDLESIGWPSYRILDTACCQCGGCEAAATNLGSVCARLYETTNCGSCSGFRLDLKEGDEAKNFGILNNRMSSVAVRNGCTMNVYSDPGFGGWRFNYTTSSNVLDNRWLRQISSAKCGCEGGAQRPPSAVPTRPSHNVLPVFQTNPPQILPTAPATKPPQFLPTAPATKPPITLPTVPTTKRLITLPTVPTTKAPITLPTVPTTKPPITLPTIPATKAPITLPTVPTTPDAASAEDDMSFEVDWFGGEKSNEILPSTNGKVAGAVTAEPTTKKTVSSSSWGFDEDHVIDEVEPVSITTDENDSEDGDDDESEEDDDWFD